MLLECEEQGDSRALNELFAEFKPRSAGGFGGASVEDLLRRVYSSNVFENSSVDNDEVLSAQTSNSVLDERRIHNLDSLRFCYNDICKEVPFPVFDSWRRQIGRASCRERV